MTHGTEQERAGFEAWWGTWDSHAFASDGAKEFAFATWQAARRAQVVPKEPTSKQVVLGAGALLVQPEHTADNRHPDWPSAVEKVRKVYMTMLAAAPQPPDAAPVQMPEPVEYQYRTRPTWDDKHPWTEWAKCSPEAAANYERVPLLHDWAYEVRRLYTEHQVRELLGRK